MNTTTKLLVSAAVMVMASSAFAMGSGGYWQQTVKATVQNNTGHKMYWRVFNSDENNMMSHTPGKVLTPHEKNQYFTAFYNNNFHTPTQYVRFSENPHVTFADSCGVTFASGEAYGTVSVWHYNSGAGFVCQTTDNTGKHHLVEVNPT